MPVRKRSEADPVKNRQQLIDALRDEWEHNRSGPGAPDIEIVEGGRVFGMIGRPIRIKVVWEQWEGIDAQDRASMIMDVFQQLADQPEDILRVTSVMGLTPAEANTGSF